MLRRIGFQTRAVHFHGVGIAVIEPVRLDKRLPLTSLLVCGIAVDPYAQTVAETTVVHLHFCTVVLFHIVRIVMRVDNLLLRLHEEAHQRGVIDVEGPAPLHRNGLGRAVVFLFRQIVPVHLVVVPAILRPGINVRSRPFRAPIRKPGPIQADAVAIHFAAGDGALAVALVTGPRGAVARHDTHLPAVLDLQVTGKIETKLQAITPGILPNLSRASAVGTAAEGADPGGRCVQLLTVAGDKQAFPQTVVQAVGEHVHRRALVTQIGPRFRANRHDRLLNGNPQIPVAVIAGWRAF